MKITIHKTVNRPWGPETAYTVVDNDETIYDGCLQGIKITEKQVIETITAQKLKRLDADKITKEELGMRKAELINEISEIDKQIAELSEGK